MAHQIIKDARLWIAQYDIAGHANRCVLDYAAEMQDDTPLNVTARKRMGGLKTIALQCEGMYEAGVGMPDELIPANLGVADVPVSLCPIAGAAVGSRAFTFRANLAEYQLGGLIGEMARFSAGAEASQGPLVRGEVLHNTTQTASGNGSARQLGAVTSQQRLYAALHILAVSGTLPTLNVKIQSDNGAGFGTPADQITFTQANAVGSQWGSVVGAITDDYWRVNFTIGGTNPSFTFVIVAGIADLS